MLFTAPDLASVTSHIHNCVLLCFGSIPSFFLELFLHWSPVALWAPTDLGSSSFSILSFCLFILFMGFSRQEYWSGLPFPSPFCHTSPPWPNCFGWPHTALLSLIELDKSVWSDWLVFCDYGFSVSALSQHLPSYSGFSYLGRGVSLHDWSSKAQPLHLTLDDVAPPDLELGVAPLGPPAPAATTPWMWGYWSGHHLGFMMDTKPKNKWKMCIT